MTVSEKLIQIAENMEKVYEAGAKPYTQQFEINSSEPNNFVLFNSSISNYPIKTETIFPELAEGQMYSGFATSFLSSKNLYDDKAYPLQPGYIARLSGKYTNSGNYYCAQKILIPNLTGQTFYLNCSAGSGNPGMAFYDKDGNFLAIVNNGLNRVSAVVPEGTRFFSFSITASEYQAYQNGEKLVQITLNQEDNNLISFQGDTVHHNIAFSGGVYDWNTGTLTTLEGEQIQLKSCPVVLSEGDNYICASIGTIKITNIKNLNLTEMRDKNNDYGELQLLNKICNQGEKTDYAYGFYRWYVEYIRPNFKIVPKSTSRLTNLFYSCTNLKKVEAKYFDLSLANITTKVDETGLYNIFYYCQSLEEIEDIGLPAGGYYQTFRVCRNLKKIHKIRVNENCQFSNAFNACESLEEISEIEGFIGQSGLNFSWSPLNKATITRIINALSDTASEKEITLRQSAVNAAFTTEEWDQLKNSKSNWTITLIDS